MRVSTMQMNNTMQYNMMSTTSSMNDVLIQMSTGKRINSPSDDVLASTQIMSMEDEIAQLESYENNINASINTLTLAETVISDMVDVMNSVRDNVLAFGGLSANQPVEPDPANPSVGTDPGEKQPVYDDAYLQEIEMQMEHMEDLANTTGPSGEYIFGGTMGDEPPLTSSEDGEFDVGGSDEAREVQISDTQTVTVGVVAEDLFVLEDGDNIFNVMDEFVATASDPDTTPEEMEVLIEDTINAIDETLDNMNQALTMIGASINTLESAQSSNAEMQMYNDMMVSGLEDLDYAEAITEFQMLQLQLQASQASFAMVNETSLFDYM